jgi:hypothetical protein
MGVLTIDPPVSPHRHQWTFLAHMSGRGVKNVLFFFRKNRPSRGQGGSPELFFTHILYFCDLNPHKSIDHTGNDIYRVSRKKVYLFPGIFGWFLVNKFLTDGHTKKLIRNFLQDSDKQKQKYISGKIYILFLVVFL